MGKYSKIFLLFLCIGICFFTRCSCFGTYALKIEDIEIAKNINLVGKIIFTKREHKKTGTTTSVSTYRMDANGENQICLAKYKNKRRHITTPVFSPDGKKIAFVIGGYVKHRFLGEEMFEDIFMIDINGKETLKKLTYNGKSFSPVFSPDGKRIAFVKSSKEFGGKEIWDIYMIIDVDDKEPLEIRKITTGGFNSQQVFSLDGKKLLFVYSEPYKNDNASTKDKMYLIDIDNGNKLIVTNSGYRILSPSFSPDGKKIVFAMIKNKDEGYDIYLINSDGTNLVRLTSTPDSEFSPSFSPDGTKIVFKADNKIYIMFSDGKDKKIVFEYQKKNIPGSGDIWDNSSIDSAVFSPDGKKIIFVLEENVSKTIPSISKDKQFEIKEEYDYANIYTVDVSGDNLTNLTDDKFSHNESPCWCPIQELE